MDCFLAPYLKNQTSGFQAEGSTTLSLVFGITISLLICIPNYMLIHGLRNTCSKPKKGLPLTKKLYILMSFSDLGIGNVYVPYEAIAPYVFERSNCKSLFVFRGLAAACTSLSLLMVSLISILRYISITRPFSTMNNRRKVFAAASVCFNMMLFLKVGVLWSVIHLYFHDSMQAFSIMFFYLLTWTIVLITFNQTINLMSLRALKISSTNVSTSAGPRMKRLHNAIITLSLISFAAIVGAFGIIGFFFYAGYVMTYIESWLQFDRFAIDKLSKWISAPFCLNSGVNALIYLLKSKELKKYYRAKFCCHPDRSVKEMV